MHRASSTGPVSYFKGGCHISPGKGGSQEKGGIWKSGEGAKGGEDGAMYERAWVGKERQMPYGDLVCVVSAYFFNYFASLHRISLYFLVAMFCLFFCSYRDMSDCNMFDTSFGTARQNKFK